MSFVRKGLGFGAGQLIIAGGSFLTGIIFARGLGPNGMGQYALLQTTALFAATFAALGLGPSTVYFLNNRKVPVDIVTTITLKFCFWWGSAVCIGIALLVSTAEGFFGRFPIWIVALFGLGVGAQFSVGIVRQLLTARLAVRPVLWLDLLRVLALFVPALVLALLGLLTVEVAVSILSAASFVRLAYALPMVWQDFRFTIPFDCRLLLRIFNYGVKLSAANLLYLLSLEVAMLVLRHLMNDDFAPIGIYSRAVSLCGLIAVLPRALGPLLFAKWSEPENSKTGSQIEATLRVMNTYGLAAFAGILLFGEELIVTLYGREFLGARGPLTILALSTVCVSDFIVLTRVLAGTGRVRITILISSIAVGIIVATTYILVPNVGIAGAAVATLIGSAFSTSAAFFACAQVFGVRVRKSVFVSKSDLAAIVDACCVSLKSLSLK